jgi:hypothetical protein
MTGRAAGFCAGYSAPGYINPAPGRGRGFNIRPADGYGRGGGSGWRHRCYATGLSGWQKASAGRFDFEGVYPYAPEMTPKQETDILRNEAGFLKKRLEDIQGRIETLEKIQERKSE